MVETVTLAGGCFWCLEAVFNRLKGVEKVVSGYTGGTSPHPTYEDVCSGTTGYAEAVQITFNSITISLQELLEVFWKLHNPTTLNRQGNDIGTQYRSAIFYTTPEQQEKILASKKELEGSGYYSDPVVTEISPLTTFYPSETYHQNFYNNNSSHNYCRLVIDPKIEKLYKNFEKLAN